MTLPLPFRATPPTVTDVPALRAAVAELRRDAGAGTAARGRIALVPTMGALHAGHLALIDAARAAGAARVVVSIFVNPTQFGPGEDFDRYPRDIAADAAALAAAGGDLLFAPDAAAMYPAGHATSVRVGHLGEILDGGARPGHFAGVATVVAKLLIAAAPDIAVFGEKDWQQLAVIRQMVADLALPVEIVGAEIVRDTDGLALSSRNAYLTAHERRRAVVLPQALARAAVKLRHREELTAVLTGIAAELVAAGFDQPDYVTLVDADFAPLTTLDRPARLLAAARIGGTRLIDNLAVSPS